MTSSETSMTWRRLLWFDLTRGTWTGLGALRRELGWWRFTRTMLSFSWRSLVRDPFRGLPRRKLSRRERFTRHQMRPVLLLDEVLRCALGLSPQASRDVLRAVVSRSGARFLRYTLELPDHASWSVLDEQARRSLVGRFLALFFNMEAELVSDPTAQVAFDVNACLFAQLGAELDRGELVPLFCAADSAYFDDPGVAVGLRRAETIATGGERCAFRLSYKDS